jgi:hypothetical protein
MLAHRLFEKGLSLSLFKILPESDCNFIKNRINSNYTVFCCMGLFDYVLIGEWNINKSIERLLNPSFDKMIKANCVEKMQLNHSLDLIPFNDDKAYNNIKDKNYFSLNLITIKGECFGGLYNDDFFLKNNIETKCLFMSESLSRHVLLMGFNTAKDMMMYHNKLSRKLLGKTVDFRSSYGINYNYIKDCSFSDVLPRDYLLSIGIKFNVDALNCKYLKIVKEMGNYFNDKKLIILRDTRDYGVVLRFNGNVCVGKVFETIFKIRKDFSKELSSTWISIGEII